MALPKKRETVLKKLYKMAQELARAYDRDKYNAMWELCYEWNSEHGEAEIFMCEDEDEAGEFRYYIEDDYFYLGQ